MDHLHYQVCGPADAPAALLLHGFLSSNAQWLPNRESLAECHRLVMVELWGHGRSPAPDDPERYTITAYLEEFERIREAVELERWAVIGQSYGAGLVVHYALAHPNNVSGVLVTNSRSAFGTVAPRQERLPSALDPRSLPIHPINARRLPAAVKAALVRDADRVSPRAAALGASLASELHVADRLFELTCPLRIANGRYEKSFQEDLAPLREVLAEGVIIELQGGHSINIEAATAFNETTLRFLRECSPEFA